MSRIIEIRKIIKELKVLKHTKRFICKENKQETKGKERILEKTVFIGI